ncbi:MAG TPA: polyhydroxyalkanoate depolymerase [Burkholderiales bacterium]|nr:polyhydroxyalkanoate depolymerase [Burkholderiales bacterium]
MIYQLHEFHKTAMAPAVLWADAAKRLFSSPFSPFAYTPLSRTAAAGSELFVRLMRRYPKPEWRIEHTVVDGRPVAVRREIVVDKPFCHLLHFRKEPAVAQPKLLIVAPLSGHFATLLRDTVRTALPDHDVWITDWIDAKMVPLSRGEFHLDDYVDYIREFIRFLAPDLNVMSVCQPTVPVLAAVSLMAAANDPAVPKSMIMMGGPIDTRRNPTVVNDFATGRPHSWFSDKVILRVPANYPGFMRRVYPGFLQHASFLSMNPDRHLDSHWKFYLHLVRGDGDSAAAHREFYDEYNAVLDMPAAYYLDTIKVVFQEFQLPKGRWQVRGERVAPEAIRNTALFTIEGELDDISGNGQTEAAHVLCRSIPGEKRKHLLAKGVGHYGIFSGRKFREMIYPQIREFIDHQREQERTKRRLRIAR